MADASRLAGQARRAWSRRQWSAGRRAGKARVVVRSEVALEAGVLGRPRQGQDLFVGQPLLGLTHQGKSHAPHGHTARRRPCGRGRTASADGWLRSQRRRSHTAIARVREAQAPAAAATTISDPDGERQAAPGQRAPALPGRRRPACPGPSRRSRPGLRHDCFEGDRQRREREPDWRARRAARSCSRCRPDGRQLTLNVEHVVDRYGAYP